LILTIDPNFPGHPRTGEYFIQFHPLFIPSKRPYMGGNPKIGVPPKWMVYNGKPY